MKIAVAIIIQADSILISRRLKGSHLGGLWEFPGGKLEAGEDPEKAVRREVEEETGLRLVEVMLLHRQAFVYPGRQVDITFFLAGDFTGELSGREGQEIRWVPARALPDYPMPPANAEVVRLIVEQYT